MATRYKNSNAKWRYKLSRASHLHIGGEYIPTYRVRWHKARVPGTIRNSRKPGGNGFRGLKQWNAHHGEA